MPFDTDHYRGVFADVGVEKFSEEQVLGLGLDLMNRSFLHLVGLPKRSPLPAGDDFVTLEVAPSENPSANGHCLLQPIASLHPFAYIDYQPFRSSVLTRMGTSSFGTLRQIMTDRFW